ncbi:unnamed protein product, partial [Discosporangium mesarthrocarpum]
RYQYLEKTLKAVVKYHPGGGRDGIGGAMPVIISEDGSKKEIAQVIGNFREEMGDKAVVIHSQHSNTPPLSQENGYIKLAAHFKAALDMVFNGHQTDKFNPHMVDKVIILEEDLLIAPDFFEYFSAMAPLLDRDDTLMAISAWNDNGMEANVREPDAVYRSDFFPGLGWMVQRRIWEELSPKWPRGYWDDWLREPEQRKGRQFIRPEISRTFHFGVKGTSHNQYSTYLVQTKLNDQQVNFRSMDLSFLEHEKYEEAFLNRVRSAELVSAAEAINMGSAITHEVRVAYGNTHDFEKQAKKMGIMGNIKAGVPRTAYQGVVTFWLGGIRVYLVPKSLGM